MKILYLMSEDEDYLADTLFHGLRQLFGKNVVDYPKKQFLYRTYSSNPELLYGCGFTIYRTLDDIEVERNSITEKVKTGFFDLIVFSNIHLQFKAFKEYLPYLNKSNTAILDGSDSPSLYPYSGFFWRKLHFFVPRAHTKFYYYKREWTPETNYNRWFKLIPKSLCKYLPYPSNLLKISFSIPEEKIVKELPIKTKLFPRHIVDEEVARNIEGSSSKYVFDSEEEYYSDLKCSKFAITTKRGGWDCIRHYEITANGAVPCFNGLYKKPRTCAPHNLNESNCIMYSDYNDLIKKIDQLTEERYKQLQKGALEWVNKNTTVEKAKYLLKRFNYT